MHIQSIVTTFSLVSVNSLFLKVIYFFIKKKFFNNTHVRFAKDTIFVRDTEAILPESSYEKKKKKKEKKMESVLMHKPWYH